MVDWWQKGAQDMEQKALIAMSGGVDSSVAAYLTKAAGYRCIGATMRLFDNELLGQEQESSCCSLSDVEDARSVAFRLGMPYYVLNFREEFTEKVIEKFARAYEQGATPNPCIDCNRYLKFEALLARAQVLGCQWVVTGHYARIVEENGQLLLKKAVDRAKDQSYFLYTLTREQLRHIRFPLGELSKEQAREIAAQQGFLNARKRDSQDICFVPDGDYLAFLERYRRKSSRSGDFLDQSGRKIGTHRGAAGYTLGQRKGLGVALGQPVYVCGKDMVRNTVTLGPDEALYRRTLVAGDWNWLAIEPPREPLRCAAKTRSRQAEQPGWLSSAPDGRARFTFDEPQRAITPGQAVVLYEGDTVLGGGTIESTQD